MVCNLICPSSTDTYQFLVFHTEPSIRGDLLGRRAATSAPSLCWASQNNTALKHSFGSFDPDQFSCGGKWSKLLTVYPASILKVYCHPIPSVTLCSARLNSRQHTDMGSDTCDTHREMADVTGKSQIVTLWKFQETCVKTSWNWDWREGNNARTFYSLSDALFTSLFLLHFAHYIC